MGQPYHGDYMTFFQAVGVPDRGRLDLGRLVEDIKAISQIWRGKAVPSDVCIQMGTLLDDALHAGLVPIDPGDLDVLLQRGSAELRHVPIFPVHIPDQGVQLLSADSNFYVANKAVDDLARLFSRDCPILRTVTLQDPADTREFEWVSNLIYDLPGTHLSSVVMKSVRSTGTVTYDRELSRSYGARIINLQPG